MISLKYWNGRYFEATTLKDLGLVVQVGHPPGVKCRNPQPGPRDFMVMHTNGLHPVAVQFCDCDKLYEAGDALCQLLRYELYPATIVNPTTCFTFRLLDTFQILTLQSKIAAYDFYMSMDYLGDNAGLGTSHVSPP